MHRSTIFLLSAVALIGGCSQTDPLYKAGAWNPSGVNDSNLAAQVADPEDLVHGQGREDSDGQQAADAVDRLRRGTLKAFPTTDGTAPAAQPSPSPAMPAASSGNT